MEFKNFSIVLLPFFVSFLLNGSVEHKDEFIDVYLSNISHSMDEKTQLLEHILKNPSGHFVDIGTGGDSIAIIAKQLPKNCRPTLMAADIDPLVIESIKKRRPEIHHYINNSKGPKVELITMSATNMEQLIDNSITGIGASAVAHEIFSYVPIQNALDQFVSEVCRVLEKNGVLVYRDPKWVDNPKIACIMSAKSELCKYYTTLFLTKFLDRKHSLIKDYRGECCKPTFYSEKNVKVTVFLKALQANVQLDFSEFLKIPSSDIDYTKDFSVEAPRGLIAEIQRHYLMYLHDYYPLGLLDDTYLNHSIKFSELSQDQVDAIKSYANRKKIPLIDDQIEQNQMALFAEELIVLRKIFSKKYSMSTKNESQTWIMINSLLSNGLDRNLFYTLDNKEVVIDPKMLVLNFQGKETGLFSYLEKENLPLDLLEHLKLEGEEHYFYKTTDELITYMGQYSEFILKNGPKKGYCLAPVDQEHIIEGKRVLYHALLEKDTRVIDLHGNVQSPVTEKNIIHFQLQPVQKAFATYKKLVREAPNKYHSLKQWIDMGTHEMLDLVSSDDVVIGILSRTEIYAKNLNNFRVVNAFLINSKGELWIPTRALSKKLFPGCFDCSVGGHVMADETYFDAFCRETQEELNLSYKKFPYSLLAKLTPEKHGTSAFMEVYTIQYEGPVDFNKEDFIEGQWISPKALKIVLKHGAPAKSDLGIILDACFPDA